MLEIESKLRRRSFDVRFRFSTPYSSGEPVRRFDDGKKFVLPEIDLEKKNNNIKSDQLIQQLAKNACHVENMSVN